MVRDDASAVGCSMTVTRPALLSSVAYIMQAAGITLAELAQHMGVKLEAAPIVIEPPAELNPDALTPRVVDALRHCDNADGASIPELMAVMGLSIQTVSSYVAQLQRLRRLVKVKAPGVRSPRCFVDPQAAQRWVDSHTQAAEQARQQAMQMQAAEIAERQQRDAQRLVEHQAQQEQHEQDRSEAKRARAEKAAASQGLRVARQPPSTETEKDNIKRSAPKAGGGIKLQGEAVETEATRRTIDSTQRPTARWQAQQMAADPRWPSFSSTPLGVNPDTGRAWEGRA